MKHNFDKKEKNKCMVHELIEHYAEKSPEKVAVTINYNSITYLDLNKRVNYLVAYLVSKNIQPKKAIGLFFNRSLNMLVAMLAVMKIGAYYVPLDVDFPKKRIKYILNNCNITSLLSDQECIRSVIEYDNIDCIDIDSLNISDALLDYDNSKINHTNDDLAYCIYTSGSSGTPKGVAVSHKALMNYLSWAKKEYITNEINNFAFFTTPSFDFSITSIFLPLISGGTVYIYPNDNHRAPSIYQVLKNNDIDIIKITPAHIGYFDKFNFEGSNLKKIIIGGENLKASSAEYLFKLFNGRVTIYNEYGPTEATVGCIAHCYDHQLDTKGSVPIGKAIDNVQISIMDDDMCPVQPGMIGEIYISGACLAKKYINDETLTSKKFVKMPEKNNEIMYITGDLACMQDNGQIVYLGRKDEQIKLHGYRIEVAEIENILSQHDSISECVVSPINYDYKIEHHDLKFCKICGVSSTFPNTHFDKYSVCNHCKVFDEYKEAIQDFFLSMRDLESLVDKIKYIQSPEYDCILALSGGKDSTYVLCRLHEMGLRIFTFTLDNGYISDEAKENINRSVHNLGVDHRYVSTPHMKEILLDSFKRYSDACNGCFKTIYSYSINIAKEFNVDYIFTGLSRGQIFETRMSELLRSKKYDEKVFEKNLATARKIYHQVDDIVKQALVCDWSNDDRTFEKIQFIDFYRYCNVSRDQIYSYIEEKADWKRPSDTGRSTNCLLNDVSIYVHGKERGYHKYELPYSWDVRMNHIMREEAIQELDDSEDINEEMVNKVLSEIGYKTQDAKENNQESSLVAYYLSSDELDENALRQYALKFLPEYMIPNRFIRLDKIPITPNGKINKRALPVPVNSRKYDRDSYVPPETEVEKELASIWKDLLRIEKVGVNDNFFEIGGYSFSVLTMLLRIYEKFNTSVDINEFSENPTIASLSSFLEDR